MTNYNQPKNLNETSGYRPTQFEVPQPQTLEQEAKRSDKESLSGHGEKTGEVSYGAGETEVIRQNILRQAENIMPQKREDAANLGLKEKQLLADIMNGKASLDDLEVTGNNAASIVDFLSNRE